MSFDFSYLHSSIHQIVDYHHTRYLHAHTSSFSFFLRVLIRFLFFEKTTTISLIKNSAHQSQLLPIYRSFSTIQNA